jgi:hypothetical protein
MLPGFRFLFAAIVLSMSILVFGLGAAALLRAAHEEFASNPSWHAHPETMFAQQAEATRPVLAMLRIEPPAAAQKAQDDVAAPAEPAAIAPAPAESEGIAALKPRETSVPEAAIPVRESRAQSEAAAAQADTLSVADTRIAAPDAETKVASTEQASPPAQIMSSANEAASVAAEPAASEPMGTMASPEFDAVSTKIATLGGPPVIIETPPPAKAVGEKSDRSAVKKRLQARRAAHRHRIAARARLAAQQAQLQANPFAQALPQPPAVARR